MKKSPFLCFMGFNPFATEVCQIVFSGEMASDSSDRLLIAFMRKFSKHLNRLSKSLSQFRIVNESVKRKNLSIFPKISLELPPWRLLAQA